MLTFTRLFLDKLLSWVTVRWGFNLTFSLDVPNIVLILFLLELFPLSFSKRKLYMILSLFSLLPDLLNFLFRPLYFLKSETSLRLFWRWLLGKGYFLRSSPYCYYFFFYLKNLFEYYFIGTVNSLLSLSSLNNLLSLNVSSFFETTMSNWLCTIT